MEYIGKLYGKVGRIYFPMIETTEDIDKLKTRIGELETKLKNHSGLSNVSGFSSADMEKAFEAGAYEHHLTDAKTFVKNYR